MTPEYIEQLAKIADPDDLWREGPPQPLGTWRPSEWQQKQLDMGVALRRYASHLRDLNAIRGRGLSLLITPLSTSGTYTSVIATPDRTSGDGDES